MHTESAMIRNVFVLQATKHTHYISFTWRNSKSVQTLMGRIHRTGPTNAATRVSPSVGLPKELQNSRQTSHVPRYTSKVMIVSIVFSDVKRVDVHERHFLEKLLLLGNPFPQVPPLKALLLRLEEDD